MVDIDRRWQGLAVTARRRPPRALGGGARGSAGALRPRAGRAARACAVRAPVARMAGRAAVAPRRRDRCAARGSSPRCARSRKGSTTTRPFRCWRTPNAASATWERERAAQAGAEALVVEAETARGGNVDRPRGPSGALGGARPEHARPRADAALRGRADRDRAAPARADPGDAAAGERRAPARARAAAHRRAGARRRPVAGGARRRGRDQDRQDGRRRAAEADGAAPGPPRAAADRARALGIVRPAAGAPAALRARRGAGGAGHGGGEARGRGAEAAQPNGRRSTSSMRACRRPSGNVSTAPASAPMRRPRVISRRWPPSARKRAGSARSSSRPRRRTCRRSSPPSRAICARSSAGCARPTRRGAKAISAASSPARGRSSTRG